MTKPESKTALKWMDAASALTKNEAVLQWMEEMAAMTQPDKIVWITGEEEQLEALRKQAVEEGILIKLNEYKLPGCYLHRTDPDDVARVEDRTFICCEREEDAGPTNHWMDPQGNVREDVRSRRRRLQGPHDVCHPVLHVHHRLAVCQVRL